MCIKVLFLSCKEVYKEQVCFRVMSSRIINNNIINRLNDITKEKNCITYIIISVAHVHCLFYINVNNNESIPQKTLFAPRQSKKKL